MFVAPAGPFHTEPHSSSRRGALGLEASPSDIWGSVSDHVFKEGKPTPPPPPPRCVRSQERPSTQQEDERTARGQAEIKGKSRCITVLFSKPPDPISRPSRSVCLRVNTPMWPRRVNNEMTECALELL